MPGNGPKAGAWHDRASTKRRPAPGDTHVRRRSSVAARWCQAPRSALPGTVPAPASTTGMVRDERSCDPLGRRRAYADGRPATSMRTGTTSAAPSGSERVGLNRIRIEPGRRSTPAHIHGAEEEIFYVLDGWGLLWQDGDACEVRAGDVIAHPAGARHAHACGPGPHGLDVLAFGQRVPIELCYLPRAGHAWAGPTVVETPGLREPVPIDDAAGPFEFGAAGDRPANVVALADVPPADERRGRVRRNLGVAAGSRHTGLRHVAAPEGVLTCVPHCHSAEEELFVVLEGRGVCRLGDESHRRAPRQRGRTSGRHRRRAQLHAPARAGSRCWPMAPASRTTSASTRAQARSPSPAWASSAESSRSSTGRARSSEEP